MKILTDILSSSWIGVISHKLRSFLTILGIVIGVSAVIALMSIGRGTQAEIMENIESLGANLMTISPGSTTSFGGVRTMSGSSTTLTLEDAEAIDEEIDSVENVSPYLSTNTQLIVGSENVYASMYGVSLSYFTANNINVADGYLFTEYDYYKGNKMVVIGTEIEETLFPDGSSAVGQTVKSGNNLLLVVGVLESKETFSMTDSSIYIPLTTFQQISSQGRTSSGGHIISGISLSLIEGEDSDTTTDEITSLLRTRHQLATDDDDDFRISSMEEIAATLDEAMGSMTLLLGAIAAISLLVGGIGVMNIMLVSVLERTREIGIRKALGAQESDIWIQFLVEAALLSFTGGIVGVIVGWVISFLVNMSGVMTTLVTADIVLLAVGVSIGIGLFFGFYPAWNASKLDPIQALRTE